MGLYQLAAVVVAMATWGGFAGIMRKYFRHSKESTPAKTLLLVTGFLATLAQLVAIALSPAATPAWFWTGVGGFAVANGLFWWALQSHGKAHPAFVFIPVPPSALTTAGPYRLVRHPIYAAYLLAWIAGATIVAQPWLLTPAVLMSLFYVTAARQEEQAFLTSEFAAPYREYQRRTGMFVPNVIGVFQPIRKAG